LHNKIKDDAKKEGPTAAVKSSEAKPLDVTFEGYFRLALHEFDDDSKFPLI